MTPPSATPDEAPPRDDRTLAAFLAFTADGTPVLRGKVCRHCNEVLVGEYRACPRCGTVGALEDRDLSSDGTLYSYTIVHRSFPGVKTPIISAIVRLADGAFVRANLEGIAPDPAVLSFDMPVRARIETTIAEDGTRLLRPVFHPVPITETQP